MGYNSRNWTVEDCHQNWTVEDCHQNWTVEDWKNVAWSDESRFLLRRSDGGVRIWA